MSPYNIAYVKRLPVAYVFGEKTGEFKSYVFAFVDAKEKGVGATFGCFDLLEP